MGNWPQAIVIAADVTKLLITGIEMKLTTKPVREIVVGMRGQR